MLTVSCRYYPEGVNCFSEGLWMCLSICVYLYTYLDVYNLIFQGCLSGYVLLGNLNFSQLINN